MKIKRILCAVDFSQPSILAFQAAVELAKLYSAALFVIHVIEAYPTAPELIAADELGETMLALEEKASAAMEALISSSARSLEAIRLKTQITSGQPFAEILNCARENEANLIVLGATGASSIELSGSTAERVMKNAQCWVLIVR
jgi:universal stress protein A